MIQANTRSNKQMYGEKRKIANEICKSKKRLALKHKLTMLETYRQQNNNVRDFYRCVRNLNKGYQPRLAACKDEDGTLVVEENKVMNRWRQYFENLLNAQQEDNILGSVENNRSHLSQQNCDVPSQEDVENALQKLKNFQVPGENLITAELYKHGGVTLISALHNLVCKIWQQESMPTAWKTSLIYPIYKKGNKLECSNYRGIALLDVAYKILSNVIYNKINGIIESKIGEYQSGLRSNRSTIDHIFTVRQSIEKCYEYNIDLHMLFIDFSQAFDSIRRSQIIEALRYYGTPEKLIRLIEMILGESNAKVVIQNMASEMFRINSGVKQGDALFALLFNITLHYAIGSIQNDGTILNKSYQIYAYADDIVIMSRSFSNMVEIFHRLQSKAARVGPTINQNKTKYLKLSRSAQVRTPQNITINNYVFEGVSSFKYLGVLVNSTNDTSMGIQDRIQAASKCYYANIKVFSSRLLSKTTKMRLYKTLVRPVATYGAEAWIMTVSDENKLRVFERRILRKIYGPKRLEDGSFSIRSNDELNNLIESEDIVRFVKSIRLRWAGHVMRMEESRQPLQVLRSVPQNKRYKGRPRQRWIDNISSDTKRLGISNWKMAALNRDRWRLHVEEAKTHTGL